MDLSVFKKGSTVAAAVSGGMDSMVMLHKLNAVKEDVGFKLAVVNVNHNLRERSAGDSRFVKTYAERLGLEFFGFSVDVKEFAAQNKLSVETAARALRYRAFDDVNADCVALAHHMSDQAESVLMNIVRGSGINGAAGMKTVNGRFVRPLLNVSKDEIKKYQEEHSIPFVEDETNADDAHSRNFLRNNIMPLLKQLNKRAEDNICKFAERLREDEEFLKTLAAAEEINFDNASLWKRRVVFSLNEMGVKQDIEARHLDLIKELAVSGQTGSSLDLPHGVKAVKDYGKVIFIRENEEQREVNEIPFKIGDFLMNGKLISVRGGEGRFKFDLGKVPPDAVFRYRREGDIFAKYGGGTKKFKDFLIDKKIPQRFRDGLIVLAAGNEVLFAEGIETNGKIWVDEKTKKVYNINITYAEE